MLPLLELNCCRTPCTRIDQWPPPHLNNRLNLQELESRVVPSWWVVSALSQTEGILGDTAAIYSGSLTLDADYLQSDGNAKVWADSAAEAVAVALQGTITVNYNGVRYDQVFGSSNDEAFDIAVTGETATIQFEDMAHFPGETADYDYNDRLFDGMRVWEVVPASSLAKGPTDQDELLLHGPNVDEETPVESVDANSSPVTFDGSHLNSESMQPGTLEPICIHEEVVDAEANEWVLVSDPRDELSEEFVQIGWGVSSKEGRTETWGTPPLYEDAYTRTYTTYTHLEHYAKFEWTDITTVSQPCNDQVGDERSISTTLHTDVQIKATHRTIAGCEIGYKNIIGINGEKEWTDETTGSVGASTTSTYTLKLGPTPCDKERKTVLYQMVVTIKSEISTSESYRKSTSPGNEHFDKTGDTGPLPFGEAVSYYLPTYAKVVYERNCNK